MSISADGFVAGPNGEIDWLFKTADASSTQWVLHNISNAGLHIMGSRTFHDMLAYWPTSSHPLSAPMNEVPKAVFSKKGNLETTTGLTTRALKDARQQDAKEGISAKEKANLDTWTDAAVYTDLVNDIKKLKEQSGNYILAHGGASFAQALVATGLIDEFRLVIHPVILGKGLPLFSAVPAPFYLKLQSSTALPTGIIANIYTPV